MSLTIDYTELTESLINGNRNIKIQVAGDSMSPILRTGDAIYVEPVRPEGLSIGEIVLCKTKGGMRAHRLVEIGYREGRYIFLTKGDTFSFLDDPLGEGDIIGRVYAVEKWGRVLNLRRGIFSLLNRVAYITSPLTSLLYSVRRWWKGFDVKVGIGERSKEERFLISLLMTGFLSEKANPDTVMALKGLLDLSKVLKMARDNGVSQGLYTVLKGWQFEDDAFMAELRRDYLSTAIKNTFLYSEFQRVVKGFKEAGIKVMAMKGVTLTELVYQDIGVRPMSDIDLLIKRQDLTKVDTVLEGMGYSPVDPSIFDGIGDPNNYLTTRDYRAPDPLHPSFHIHWHMVNSSIPAPYSARVDMEEIWRDALPVEIGGVPLLSMAPHHLLIHLSEHAMRVTHSASKLIYLMDVAALIKRCNNPPFNKGENPPFFKGGREGGFEIDWHKVVETSQRFGVDRFVYNVLALTELNTGVKVPGWVLERLKSNRGGIGERLFYLLTSRGYGFSGLSYLVHLGMNKGLTKKASFLMRTLFPPVWVLVKRYPYSPVNGGGVEAVGRWYIVLLYLYRLKEVLYHLLLLPIQRLRLRYKR